MIRITDALALDERDVDERLSGPQARRPERQQGRDRRRAPLQRRGVESHDAVKQRLTTLAGNRVTGDGVLLIDSREYRLQSQNREAAARGWSRSFDRRW
jgi:ribosome-associated protein